MCNKCDEHAKSLWRKPTDHAEEPAVIAGDAPVAADRVWAARVSTDDLAALVAERNHLRAQRDDLQALNTRLTLEKRDAAAYGDAMSAQCAEAQEALDAAQKRIADLEAAVTEWRKRHWEDRDALDAAKRDADFLREQTREIRKALGAASTEQVVEAAKRVVRERDDAAAKAQRERERGNEFLVQFYDANKRADAAERLAHEAEAQREAAAAKLAAMAVLLGSTGVR